MYADYNFYKNEYHGSVDEMRFPALAVKASAYLDYYTVGKAKLSRGLDALKMACCALVDKYYEIEEVSSATKQSATTALSVGKKSETVGSYSVTYQTADDFRAWKKETEGELSETAKMYLSGTNLLYRGGCRNVCTSYCNGL